MPRLRNARTGVVVNVSASLAESLTGVWVDADAVQEPEAEPAETDGAEYASEAPEAVTATEQEPEAAPAKSRARTTK